MKTNIAFAIIGLILIQSALNQQLSCSAGYYDPADSTGKCKRCSVYYTACTGLSTGTPNSRIVGFVTDPGTATNRLCSSNSVANGAPSYYKKDTDTCQSCKDGCSSCIIDYDFCTGCESGYVWNNDYTCIPAIIGLEAASLALLVIALVFSIIGCCTVIKAKKN